jgi:hypothetical protein
MLAIRAYQRVGSLLPASKCTRLADTAFVLQYSKSVETDSICIALKLGPRLAAEAYEWGLVEEVADPGRAFDTAMVLAGKVAAQPPLSVAMTKLTVNRLAHALDDLASHMDVDQFALASLTEDHKEGVAAFLGRRKPRFKGRWRCKWSGQLAAPFHFIVPAAMRLPFNAHRRGKHLRGVVRVVVGEPGRSAGAGQLVIARECPEVGVHRVGLPG